MSNTSPITNLHAIGELRLLRQLYEQIYIPPAVQAELMEGVRRGDHPSLEDEWEWIIIKSPSDSALLNLLLAELDAGEAEAIALAVELSADLLLMDERTGRKTATRYEVTVTGILGVLLDAKAMGYLSQVRPLLEQLKQQTGFWIGAKLFTETLRLAGEDAD